MMASVSHELRTPLNGSMSMLECALEDPKISGVSKEEYIVPALNCSHLLLHLINDILDYGQMNHEALKLTFETIDIRKVVAEIQELLIFKAKRRGIQLVTEISPDVTNSFKTDPNRLKQIINNLVGNALKFTFEGSIKIIIENQNNHRNLVKFTIEDTGLGIKPEDLTRLFKLFGTVEGSRKQNPTGCGLGLVISQDLARRLGPDIGGGIFVTSIWGEGSKFSFTIQD